MTLSYNLTGSERKQLVSAISQELNAPASYLGAPTFAYEVRGYRVSQDGTVTGKDNLDLEDALHQKGFDALERVYDEPDTYERGLGGMGATPSFEELQMTEREELGLGRERRESLQGETGMRTDDVPESDADDTLAIELPIEGFSEAALQNLARLVASKESLIKKALGVEALPIERTETTLRFPWFQFNLQPEEVFAYSSFIGALCATAKQQHRVTANEKPADNEKYAFRCFLLRLGFIGAEYKEVRKTLLSKLSGSSAFKNSAAGGSDNE